MAPEQRPPLGIMPNSIWVEKRISELTAALTRSIDSAELRTPDYWKKMDIWARELASHIAAQRSVAVRKAAALKSGEDHAPHPGR